VAVREEVRDCRLGQDAARRYRTAEDFAAAVEGVAR